MQSLILESELKSLHKVYLYFMAKSLWSELSSSDQEVFILLCLKLKNAELGLELIKLQNHKVSKYLIRKRINTLLIWIGKDPITNRLWQSMKNLVVKSSWRDSSDSRLHKEIYSGWRRHQNDQGSLRHSSEIEPLSLETGLLNMKDINLYLPVLSVGTIPEEILINSQDNGSLTMALIKAETDRFKNIFKEVIKDENL